MPTAGRVLQLNEVLDPDQIGLFIARKFHEWDGLRAKKKEEWKELYRYLYATDTRTTSNSTLPWKNTTTVPKLTQIRDNLFANYMASMFPQRRWLKWEGGTEESERKEKANAIKAYMMHVIDHPSFKQEVSKLVLDYIDHGNTIATVDWVDERVEAAEGIKEGYVGPVVVRVSPFDIVLNPAAPDFSRTPKIVRSLVSLGELQEQMQQMTLDDGEREVAEELFRYMNEVRMRVSSFQGDLSVPDDFYRVDGFSSFRAYLESGYAEVLTFYGDFYDRDNEVFLKNHIIQVVDRHKVIRMDPHPSTSGRAPIFHSGWRPRQDNLWAMGPLDNLVGMQYRLDHIENLKADFFDLTAFPPLKVRGYVEDFDWAPMEKIFIGDEGDVEILQSSVNPLNANFELQMLEAKMEELAGAPKEAMGFRTPGEKTAYEVQRLENAASRIFQSKISQFEEQILEPLLNAMLEMARRRMGDTVIRTVDDEFDIAVFHTITPEDISGPGRIRPVAARHFVERAERVQNITTFYQSGVAQDEDVRMHFSSIELARIFEELLDLEDYNLVEPNIRLTERAEAQQLAMQHEEDTLMAAGTPGGIAPDDADEPFL